MDGQIVLFEFIWVKWTIPMIATAIGGTIGAVWTLYRLYDRWSTREQRRLEMLHHYIDKEEKDITGKRPELLVGIQQATNLSLMEKNFDVGIELDEAIALLDAGKPYRAVGRLTELDRKLDVNANILERRATDLRKHRASVQVFLAALADADGNADLGLGHIKNALANDSYDPDALKYQGLLLLTKGELGQAWQSFDKLRLNSNGSAAYRAEAHLGLGSVCIRKGITEYEEAVQRLTTALNNINSLPPSVQDPLTRSYIHQQLGFVYNDKAWSGADSALALQHYHQALVILDVLPSRRGLAVKRHL
jgi:tetratricopeptide (TPR) repeat protein